MGIFLFYFFDSAVEPPPPIIVISPPIPEPILEIVTIPKAVKVEVIAEPVIEEPVVAEIAEPVSWTISGNVIGLEKGQLVQIRLRSGDKVEKRRILTDRFSFTNVIVDQDHYRVKIVSSPKDLNCNTLNSTGIATNNINNVQIICRPPKPSILLTKSIIITEGEKQFINPQVTYLLSKKKNLSYKWIKLSGNDFVFQPLGKSLTITAPKKTTSGVFKLIVTDEYQQTASETINITVNLKPTFELPEEIEGYAFQPFSVSPTNVYDESELTYSWQVKDNDKVVLDKTNDIIASFANLPRRKNNFVLSLTVTDEHGASTTHDTSIKVVSMLLTDVNYTSDLVRNCIEKAAAKHHWKRVADVSSLECIDAGISSFKDFELFTSIYNLDLTDNQISSVDLSHHIDLRSLYLTNNELTEIDLSLSPRLKVLGLSNNKLSTVDVRKQTKLTYLGLSANQLTDIELSQQEKLEALYLSNNLFSELDLSQQKILKSLDLSDNKFASIALEHQKELTNLNLNNNALTSIDLTQNSVLEELYILDNPLLNSSKLYLSTTGVESLYFEEIIDLNNMYNPDGTINIHYQLASSGKK